MIGFIKKYFRDKRQEKAAMYAILSATTQLLLDTAQPLVNQTCSGAEQWLKELSHTVYYTNHDRDGAFILYDVKAQNKFGEEVEEYNARVSEAEEYMTEEALVDFMEDLEDPVAPGPLFVTTDFRGMLPVIPPYKDKQDIVSWHHQLQSLAGVVAAHKEVIDFLSGYVEENKEQVRMNAEEAARAAKSATKKAKKAKPAKKAAKKVTKKAKKASK